MKTRTYCLCQNLTLALMFFGANLSHAAVTILQAPGAPAVAWEAENYGAYLNDPREIWTPTNDVAASGGAVLYIFGENITAAPVSFVDYTIRFATPGAYKLYYRWRADAAWATLDRFTANSFYVPTTFNATTNVTNFVAALSNGSDAQGNPSSTNYTVLGEPGLFTVTPEMVSAGVGAVLRLGTRERGFILDRLVLTTDQALNEGGFNATPNSDIDIIVQGATSTFVAFEAETFKAAYVSDPREFWTPTNDAAASGGAVLYTLGENVTAAPLSFVDYRLRFMTPGAYKLYYRWRADAAWATLDRFTANSFYVPTTFNATTNVTNYVAAQSNGSDAQGNPSSTNYTVLGEPGLFNVSPEMATNEVVVVLRIGTRERGLILDRLVLSTDQGLNESGFNALPNTGADTTPPAIVSVAGTATFTNVIIKFDEPLAAASIDSFSFTISGGLTIQSVTLDPVGLKTLTLHTDAQTPGSNYVVTFSGVTDLSGNVIPMETEAAFRAWALTYGWATREIYTGITGGGVSDLLNAAKFPGSPDSVDAFKGLIIENSPRGEDFGMRLRCFFIPPATDVYSFYIYADDQAQLSLSHDESPGGLTPLVTTPAPSSSYSPTVHGGFPPPDELVAGQRYLLEVLLKQAAGDMRLGVAASRLSQVGGAAIPPLIELRGTNIATYINPATALVSFSRQPQSTNLVMGNRARFDAQASSPGGAVSYQWQVNGVDIRGATRPVYITPPLALSDSGKQYRVVATAAGGEAASSNAVVTVHPGQPPRERPYVGINFVGGGGPLSGFLSTNDVAGVVPQANFNQITAATATGASLVNADGGPSPVTLTFSAALRYTGTGNRSADDGLFQGYVQSNNTPMSVTLGGVPAGTNYQLIIYSCGFAFQTIYDQAFSLAGAGTYPIYHTRSQTGADYNAAPGYVRMASTNANARDFGNYVVFENVSPDPSGNLVLTMTPEPPATPGVGDAMPALNALQLVRVVQPLPALAITRNTNGSVTLAWDSPAASYTLLSSPQLGAGASWTTVSGLPVPLGGAGSTNFPPPDLARFYQLRQ